MEKLKEKCLLQTTINLRLHLKLRERLLGKKASLQLQRHIMCHPKLMAARWCSGQA